MDASTAPSFALLLRRYRRAAGLTQEALAARAGLSALTISALERGVNRAPHRDTVARLGAALALAPEERTLLEAAGRDRGPAGPAPIAAGALPAQPPLVGRTREVAGLEEYLAPAAGESSPPFLMLAGEPGIGKSRLLQEALARAPGHGWGVLHGGCQRAAGGAPLGIPYAPLLEALERHLDRQLPAQRRASLQGCAWLVRLLPELAGTLSEALPAAGTLAPEQERRLLFRGVGRFLANVAGPAGTLLVLDDLQWAGADALALLGMLVRAASEVPLRVLGAYRDSEVRPHDPLGVLLADLGPAGLARLLRLGPLADADVARLLDHIWPSSDEHDDSREIRERVRQRTGGVPFFVLSCARALQVGGDGAQADSVPWDVAQSVRQRVAALPGAAREVLGAAVVAGRGVPPALLLRIAARPEREVLAALDAATGARLLVEEEDQTYGVAHDLIAEVVEADLGAARRQALHRAVADALLAHPGLPPVEQLAYHYGRSAAPERAIPYWEQAGDVARAQYARTAAAGHYEAAVAHLERAGRTLEAARLREKLGQVLYRDGRYAAALAVLEPAATAYHAADDLDRLGQVMGLLGLIHIDQGTFGEATERLLALRDPLRARGALRGLAAVCLPLSDLLAHAGRMEEALEVTQTAVEIAEALGDGALRADALMRRGWLLDRRGRPAEALADNEEAIRDAEAVGDVVTLFWARIEVAVLHGRSGDLGRWRAELGRGLAEAERFGDLLLISSAMAERAAAAEIAGDWNQARQDYERALATMRQLGQSWLIDGLLLALGRLCLKAGDRAAARRFLAEGQTLGAQTSSAWDAWAGQVALAHCDLLEGQPAAALARLVPESMIRCSTRQMSYPVLLAWALLETGALAEAEEAAAQAVARARAQNNQISLVEALWVQARVALRCDRRAEAEAAVGEGLRLARSLPYPDAEARLLRVQAALYSDKGQVGAARAFYEEALAIYRRLGARRAIEEVEEELVAVSMAGARRGSGPADDSPTILA
jgi:tetratricopeptide (TPR) repeat protein/transcriptional regulator with XRE-family HTH domain